MLPCVSGSLRILVVDDHCALLLTYKLILEQQGHSAVGVSTRKEALAELARQRFDAVICDATLDRGCSGLEVIEYAQRRHKDVSCLLITGHIAGEVIEQAKARGIRVLHKPINVHHLIATVNSLPRLDASSKAS